MAQFAPYSFPLIFSRIKGMTGMNKAETGEVFRQSPRIYDQSLAEHKDASLLCSTWGSVA